MLKTRYGSVEFCLLALACTPAQERVASDRSVLGAEAVLPQAAVEIPLLPYFRELRTVEVKIGHDTLRFLLDSGGGHTVLTPAAARRLGCDAFGRSVGHRMSGEQVEIQWCRDIALKLGSVTIAHSVIGVFDLASVLPPELPKLDGVLSLKSFGGRIVTMDLTSDRIILESATSAAARRATMSPLVARAATGDDGSSLTLFVAVQAQPGPIWLLLDSGNLVGTILSPHAFQQVASAGSDRERAAGAVDSVALQLVGMTRRSEPTIVRDIIYDGVLGTSFFLEHVVMFDLREAEPWVGSQRLTESG